MTRTRTIPVTAPTGAVVAALRRERGLSQAELAARADMHQPGLARIESGPDEPRLGALRRLLAELGWELVARPARKRRARRADG